MSTLDIAICTYQRAHVALALASIAELHPAPDCILRVIVADNDENPSAQVTVAEAAAKYGLDVTYIHAPAQNVSIARNACLDAATADYLAFIDDDALVGGEWLKEILHTMRETEAAAVLGPIIAVYAENAPKWLLHGHYHSTYPIHVKGRIVTGYCGNVLIDRRHPALEGLRFEEALGVSGGEDSDFFTRVSKAKGRIVYCRDALVYEPVTPERASLNWLIRRRLYDGETSAQRQIAAGKSRILGALSASIKAVTCFALVALSIWSPIGRVKWLLRAQMHRGSARTYWKAL